MTTAAEQEKIIVIPERKSRSVFINIHSVNILSVFERNHVVEMGIAPDKLFDVVHKANMSKIRSNDEHLYDDRGKILKPQGWKDPYKKLKKLIDEQRIQED